MRTTAGVEKLAKKYGVHGVWNWGELKKGLLKLNIGMGIGMGIVHVTVSRAGNYIHTHDILSTIYICLQPLSLCCLNSQRSKVSGDAESEERDTKKWLDRWITKSSSTKLVFNYCL